jgi:hypothetical protein
MAARGAKKARRRRPPQATRDSSRQPRPRDEPQVAAQPSATVPAGPWPFRRADVAAAGGIGAIACLLFSSTFSGSVALGDAPESVAGVKSLGVLHAPGYPSYVLLAHAFAKVVPFGSWALRVNLFSLLCATFTIVAVLLLARSFGASLIGASVGALALASSVSFWFNAGFAKHYALSGLLVTVAALAVSLWQMSGKAEWLIVAGVMLGVGIGASWELTLIMAAGLVVLIWFGPRRPGALAAGAAMLTLLVFAVASLAFMIVRARQHPAIDWGEVTDARRLVSQITQQDFRSSSALPKGTNTITATPSRVLNYLGIVIRDVGVGACLIALVGVAIATRLGRDRKLFFVGVAALNLIAVAFASGVEHINGFFTGLFTGGYLLNVLVVIAVLVALGTAPAIDWIADTIAGSITPRRYHSQLLKTIARVRPFVVIGIAAAVLAPSVVVHHQFANHRMPPLADNYAKRVLAELPRHAVLVVGNFEFAAPMRYRQVVDGERPDVVVVSSDLLGLAWYREQVSRVLGKLRPGADSSNGSQTVALVKQFRPTRPVFLDTITMYFLGPNIGYRARGFVGEVVDGTGPHPALGRGVTANDLDGADRADGLGSTRYLRFPNTFVYYFHQRAHIELAKQLLMRDDQGAVEKQLERAVALVPSDTPAQIALKHLREHDPKVADLIRGL